MRIDHIAYRVSNRDETTKFLEDALGYKKVDEFEIEFDAGSKAKCFALHPPEADRLNSKVKTYGKYHLAPEIFVSEGEKGSIVHDWVQERGGVGGIHHIAYCVDSVADTMKEWTEKGYAEFTTKEPLTCPDLTQCFTKPHPLTGVIYEFIERDVNSQGFCKDNVKDLMESTEGL